MIVRNSVYQKIKEVLAAALAVTLISVPASAASLKQETVKAWEEYVGHTEERIDFELQSKGGFLALDFQTPQDAAATRAALLRGEVVVSRVQTTDQKGRKIPVPKGMIHHWRAAIFIPKVSLEDMLSRTKNPGINEHRQDDVLESRVLSRDENCMRIYLKLIRSQIVTVTYNTEHLVQYRDHGENQASSRSTATKIAELKNADTPAELEKPIGRDRGFLWRLNSYWRYEQVDDGVIVELESITLSRSVPFIFKPLVMPIVNSVAKESMKRTMDAMRDRFSNSAIRIADGTSLTGSP